MFIKNGDDIIGTYSETDLAEGVNIASLAITERDDEEETVAPEAAEEEENIEEPIEEDFDDEEDEEE